MIVFDTIISLFFHKLPFTLLEGTGREAVSIPFLSPSCCGNVFLCWKSVDFWVNLCWKSVDFRVDLCWKSVIRYLCTPKEHTAMLLETHKNDRII